MRVDRRDDRDPIWSRGPLSWRDGARVSGGRPWLRGLGGLEGIPVQGAIRLHHIPADRDKKKKKMKRMEQKSDVHNRL